MKKRFFVLTLLLLVTLALPVGASLPLVVDNADLLTAEEEAALEAFLQEQSDRANGDLVVLTVSSLEGATAQAYADDYFDYTGYGRGENWNGALFLVAMEERQWAISTCGDVFDAMTNAALDEIEYEAVPYLGAENYAAAFWEFGDITARYAENYILYNTEYVFGSEWIVISLVAGFLIALIPMGVLKGQLNTVRMQTGAAGYQERGVKIVNSRDLFLYRNVTKKAIPRETSSSGGGGRHISSSGRSHGGRSGGF